MIDYSELYTLMGEQPVADYLAHWREILPNQIKNGLDRTRFGDIPKWEKILQALPDYTPSIIELGNNAVTIGRPDDITDQQRASLATQLKGLHPWRKGPFNLFGIDINTEWRSDWKWDRLKDHIAPLQGKNVLDVGCGNGYHCWRMKAAGANLVMGVDPSPLFIMQYQIMRHFSKVQGVYVLPLGIDDVPSPLNFFDTVFSMGVLYHRRSPVDHILQLRDTLKDGGELVLETLVIDGDVTAALIPEQRYASMGNVWFIPSVAMLELWMRRCKLKNIRVVDVTTTSTEEQRATEWMTFQSLKDFLDPDDPAKTIEGYPAPKRAVIIANK
ncbi:MAG: tRNA 5-methoxyuridine(34)/uridine 5-oxyacetic acid(34) synthase CmoB [Gammaproteobacteria bacterium]|nr:tRNA 5-methoxyuridine(34)/uridine 5-oxyacetic acid(34) synthase CmoB [Gammaproteobacteria bacterium]